jgi:hypothetical protein
MHSTPVHVLVIYIPLNRAVDDFTSERCPHAGIFLNMFMAIIGPVHLRSEIKRYRLATSDRFKKIRSKIENRVITSVRQNPASKASSC